MTNLRTAARGRPCTFRGPGCDGGGETTVLAHIRRANLAGVGQKPPDICGAWMCARCHSLFDRRERVANLSNADLDLMAFDALLRTLAQLHREELV